MSAPLQGRTLNSWFAAVVGLRNVEPRSLSMIGIDTLAHTHTGGSFAKSPRIAPKLTCPDKRLRCSVFICSPQR